MFRPPREPGSLGLLDPVVAWASRHGDTVEVVDRTDGWPPEGRLSGPLDRGAVESAFELGPLVHWVPWERGEWWLLADSYSGCRLRGTGATDTPLGSDDPTTARSRLGWSADQPDLHALPLPEGRQAAALESPTDPLGTGSAPEGVREVRVRVPPGSAGEVLERLVSAAAALDDGREVLPDWLARSFDVPLTDEEWLRWFQTGEELNASERHLRRWRTVWTRESWTAAVAPGERTWSIAGRSPLAEDGFTLRVDTTALRPPIGALKHLLTAAGVVECW